MNLFKRWKKNTKSDELLKDKIQKALDTLSKMGIKPNEDDFIEWILSEWGSERVEEDLYALVLFTLGNEREIYDQWMPLSDDVYTFDMECIEEDSDYVDVMQRLSALSKGAFAFKNIECTVNHEERAVTLSFEYDGVMYKWNPLYEEDWFDVAVITKINDMLEKKKSTKFFYNSSADQNMNLIFTSEDVVEELNKMLFIPFEMV